LGDLMDNGREWQDDGFFDKEVQRFHTIFPPNNHLHYMAGNHDIGFGQRINATRVDRFEHYFGPTFYTFEKHGFLFVVLDTVSLCSNESAIPLLDNIPQHPRTLLFTHIPLYRAASQTCGPYRRQSRSNWILNEAGYQYQNLVPEHLSNLILDKVKPLLVFSGDDHDYCKVIHRDNVPEMTLPTFSMAQG
ncbi:Metallo-dependent phosphatase-like protein, partial [Gilbertella persicaria]